MTKWKLAPVGAVTPEMTKAFAKAFDVKRQRETFAPAVSAMLEAAPPPPKLSDERIMDIYAELVADVAKGGSMFNFARAIEREILGGEHD